MQGKRKPIGRLTILAGLVLCLSLWLAPLTAALTHGPGQSGIKADHALWHAEQGHTHESAHHGDPTQHNAADHDHVPTVILPAASPLLPPLWREVWSARSIAPGGIIRDGPRRPPRLA